MAVVADPDVFRHLKRFDWASDLFHSREELYDEMPRNFATRPERHPIFQALGPAHHFLLPSKRPVRVGWSLRERIRQSTASLPFNRGTYRCQTHLTPCDGFLALDSTLPPALPPSPVYVEGAEWALNRCDIYRSCVFNGVCASKKWYGLGVGGQKRLCQSWRSTDYDHFPSITLYKKRGGDLRKKNGE